MKSEAQRARFGILILAFGDLAGFGMLIPSVQLHAERLGAPGWMIGLILSSMFIVQTVASPLWGGWSDRIGRKPVVVVCTLLSAGAMAIYGASSAIVWVLLSRILAGLGAANVSTAQAALADLTRPEDRAKALGQVGAAISCGLILGPSLGGFLDARGGVALVGTVATALSLAGLLAFCLLFPATPSRPREKSDDPKSDRAWGMLRETPALFGLFWAAAIGWFALACLEGTFGRLAERNFGRGAEVFGIVFAFESIISVTVQALFVGKLTERFGERHLLLAAFILQGIGLAIMPFVNVLGWLLVVSALYAFGNTLVNPSINSWCSRLTPESRQGTLFGMLQSARSLGFVLGPALGGILFDFRPYAPYVLAAAVSFAAGIYVLTLRTRAANSTPMPS